MPNYLSPGVYVEEVSGGVKPIAGVGTSVGAFVGLAEKGEIGKAKLITNWSQFLKEFGGFIPGSYLAYAVLGFFAEGGTSCYVVRVAAGDATKASNASISLFTITANSEGVWGNKISIEIANPSEKPEDTHFKLIVKFDTESGGSNQEVFDNIGVSDIENKLNNKSALIQMLNLNNSTTRPSNGTYQLTGGTDGINNSVNFIGDEATKLGLHAFDEVDDINIIAIPDKAGDRSLILDVLNYCKNRKDCFFVADVPEGTEPSQVKDFKTGGGIYSGNPFNSSYGALYYPWVYITEPLTGGKKLVPPSGVVAGSYANTDATRGVHKAPAGVIDGYLDSVVGVERIVTKGEHDLLNPAGINVIRSLPDGICIWGARTLSADPEWNYVNIRRLLMYIEESIDQGTQWVVFEPNDSSLWSIVKRNLTAFLTRVWRDGALFGTTPEEAFFVKVDEENNPQEVRDAGQLVIEVGVAPVKPAEFVIVRISQRASNN